ncbi:MAG: hypothetical protein ACE5OZ_04745 [Candidatus Heimdallarchaeota archaeon]
MNKSIVYYISDHGFGHATRSVAIIRALCREQPNLKILIRTSRNVKFIKKALINENVYVYKGENDFGLIESRKLSISPDRTQVAFESWVLTWDEWLREEQNRHINKVDLLISDICPQPFLLAEKLGIPSIAISNFTWLDQYRELFESDSLIDLGQAYRASSSGLVLPFNMKMTGIKAERKKNIPLVYRLPTRDLEALQSQHLPIKGRKLIFVRADGGSLAYELSLDHWKEWPGFCYVTGSEKVKSKSKRIFRIPDKEIEHQDFVMASKLVISKAGYSILSEAVAGHVPLILIKTKGFPEADLMSKEATSLGIAQLHSIEDVLEGTWLDGLEELIGFQKAYHKLPRRYTGNGCEVAVKHIVEHLKD